MSNLFQKLTKNRLRFHRTVKEEGRKSLIVGSIIATFIGTSPYLFYLYESIPDTKIWDTFLFTYDSRSWQNANLAIWVLTGKLIPLLFLLIWFFTNRHWWYHVLIVPITMYIWQVVGFFNDELAYIDEFQLIYLVPIMALIIPSIYLIRAKMFNKLNYADKTMEELEEEFMIKPKSLWGKVKQYF